MTWYWPPPGQRLRYVLLSFALSVTVLLCELSVIFGIASRGGGAHRPAPAAITWGVMGGRYALAYPHEFAGRYPYAAWQSMINGTDGSLLGFGLRVRSSGLPPAYTKVTMVAVPCWFVALISGAVAYACARKLGMNLVWSRKERRGFEAIVSAKPQADGGDVTPPLPAAQIEE